MPANRSLTIAVTFNCVLNADLSFGGTASYELTASTPSAGNIVSSDGTININNMPAFDPSQYNEDVDVTFLLISPCFVHSGSPTGPITGSLNCVWARVNGQPITITAPNGGSLSEFTIMAMTNPNVLHVIDKDADTNSYNYCLAIELPSENNYYIQLDPRIVNGPPH